MRSLSEQQCCPQGFLIEACKCRRHCVWPWPSVTHYKWPSSSFREGRRRSTFDLMPLAPSPRLPARLPSFLASATGEPDTAGTHLLGGGGGHHFGHAMRSAAAASNRQQAMSALLERTNGGTNSSKGISTTKGL